MRYFKIMYDEDEIRKPTQASINRNLETLSVDELKDYIVELKAEIMRVEEDIEKKKNVYSAADSFFK